MSLRGLRWTAEQRTGAGGLVLGADGTFGLDTMVVGGLPLPTATPLELAAAFGAANEVIAPFGLRLEPPRVTKTTGDREVRVTPLKLVLGDGTAAKPLLGPLMSEAQPVREALLEAMKGFGYGGCNLGAAGGLTFTFVDVVAAALGGNGGIDLELGGVLATTEGIDYGDPFGVIAPGLPTLPPLVAPAVRPRPAVPDVTVDEPGGLVAGVRTPDGRRADRRRAGAGRSGGAGRAAGTEPVAVLPATRRCESTSRGRVSGCSRGAPLPASAAALAAALLLFGGDWWRTRRRTSEGGAGMTSPSRANAARRRAHAVRRLRPVRGPVRADPGHGLPRPDHRPRTRRHHSTTAPPSRAHDEEPPLRTSCGATAPSWRWPWRSWPSAR